jgi:photosystem II stability/assembly factor-like uncharacterized protein
MVGILLTLFLGELCALAAVNFTDNLERPAIQGQLAEKSLYNGVVSAGERIVGVGRHGNILYSDDKGKTWKQAVVPVSSDLTAVYFPNPKKGWAVGHDGIVLHSADGGETWIKQLDGRVAAQIMLDFYTEHPPEDLPGGFMNEIERFVQEGPVVPFLDVWFENESTGYIVGAFNLIFRTTDGGRNWEPWYDRTENPMRLHMYSIRPAGEEIFIAGEQGLFLIFDRKTERFRQVATPYEGSFFGVESSSGAVIVFGMRGNVFRSTDKGANWKKIETEVPVGLTGATVAEDGRIILVSQGGHILLSSDSGISFKRIKTDEPYPATAVTFIDRDTIVIAGFNGFRLTKLQ